MAVRQPSGRVPIDRWLRSISRYDLALAAIPIAFLVVAVAATVSSVSLDVAFPAAAGVGLLVLLDTLFVHPPMQSR